jgi:hypothetical protein
MVELIINQRHAETDKVIRHLDYLSSTFRNNNNSSDHFSNSSDKEFPTISIKLPTLDEIHLKNNRLLKDAVNKYRRHERHLHLSKNVQTSSIKTIDEEILMIKAESICLSESNESHDSSSFIIPKTQISLTKLMRQIHKQCPNKINKVCLFFC